MYGSYAYGYGGYNGLIATASIGLLLGFVAFVAAIVVTVLFYKKYIAVDNIHKVQPSQALKHHDWGPFFRFEHLIVENILKVLYIFFASLIAFESAAGILSSLMGIFSDPGAVFFSIIFILIICVVLEVVTRLWFEFSLLRCSSGRTLPLFVNQFRRVSQKARLMLLLRVRPLADMHRSSLPSSSR